MFVKMRSSVIIFVLILWLACGFCKYASPKPIRRGAITKHSNNFIEYYTPQRTNKITIPIMIHLDKALTKDLTKQYKRTIKKYFQDVLKTVEYSYRRQSLNQTIYLDLLGVKMLRNATKKFQMNEDVSKYLGSYCYWQGDMKVKKKKWYYSVLFTGMDVFFVDEKTHQAKSSAGRGYMAGICSLRNSCTLVKWRAQNTAYIIAHELAHSLGIPHDGSPYNECRGQRYIMAAKYNSKNPATSWSPCSRQALEKFLKSKQSTCLHKNMPFSRYY